MSPWLEFRVLVLVSVLLTASSARASVFTVDGALGDWGVGIATGATHTVSGGNTAASPAPSPKYGASNYTGVVSGPGIATAIEDTNDRSNNYYLGPNYGGQNYDVEFLGAAITGGNLFIAILTGQRPDNGFSNYSPGDLRIVTDAGLFGLEIGGGVGVTSPISGQITKGDSGITYELNSSGNTVAVHTPPNSSQTAGSLWDTPNWIDDPILPPAPTQFEAGQMSGGTLVDDTNNLIEYIYNFSSVLDAHAVIEAKIPLSLFGGDVVKSVDWSPSCGNDILLVGVPSEAQVNPEPMSLLIWCGLALAGLGLVARRRKDQSDHYQ